MKTASESTPPENPYQIISNRHLLRGCILYVVTRPRGIELMVSTGMSLWIKAAEAEKIPCSLPQLATLICQGADLPMITFLAMTSKNMLPISDNTASGGGTLSSLFAPKIQGPQSSATTPNQSTILDDSLDGPSKHYRPPQDGRGRQR